MASTTTKPDVYKRQVEDAVRDSSNQLVGGNGVFAHRKRSGHDADEREGDARFRPGRYPSAEFLLGTVVIVEKHVFFEAFLPPPRFPTGAVFVHEPLLARAYVARPPFRTNCIIREKEYFHKRIKFWTNAPSVATLLLFSIADN